MGNILIVEDDANIRKLISVNLEKRGYITLAAADGKQAMSLFRQHSFDLVLLDMLLPDMTGAEVCTWMRRHSNASIIILSIVLEEDSKVRALDAGASDYLTKPFSQMELLARVRAVLRRSAGSAISDGTREKLQIDDLSIDFETRRVRICGENIPFTKTEYAILVELANQAGIVVDHNNLLARIWGPQYYDANHYLHVYLGRVRKKLGMYGELLETIPGVGYRLQVNKKIT